MAAAPARNAPGLACGGQDLAAGEAIGPARQRRVGLHVAVDHQSRHRIFGRPDEVEDLDAAIAVAGHVDVAIGRGGHVHIRLEFADARPTGSPGGHKGPLAVESLYTVGGRISDVDRVTLYGQGRKREQRCGQRTGELPLAHALTAPLAQKRPVGRKLLHAQPAQLEEIEIAVIVEGQADRQEELARAAARAGDGAQVSTVTVENLDAVIVAVGHVDIARRVVGHVGWPVELLVGAAGGPALKPQPGGRQ